MTTIKVSDELLERLKIGKKLKGSSSYGELIYGLLDRELSDYGLTVDGYVKAGDVLLVDGKKTEVTAIIGDWLYTNDGVEVREMCKRGPAMWKCRIKGISDAG